MDDEHRQRLARATRSLSEWLDPLAFTELHRSDVTALLTEHIVNWARSHRFRIRQQMRSTTIQGRPGLRAAGAILDLACIHPSGQQSAIELDGDNKVWSIEKLAAEAETGRLAIWVKWGRPANLTGPHVQLAS